MRSIKLMLLLAILIVVDGCCELAKKMLMYEDKQFDVEEGVIDEAIVSLLGKFVYRIKYKITPIIVKKCG